MFEDILVPTDGSECADVAVGYAEDLAERYDATVHVLSVVDSRTLENAPHHERTREECEDVVETVCEDLGDEAHPVAEAVQTGVPHRQILEYVDEHEVDLVVMGTHGRTGVERYLLGSVTEKIVRASPVPVLTVRSEPDRSVSHSFSDVLVPTDGSETASAAADVAIDVAGTFDARLHALSVVDTMSMGVEFGAAGVLETLENAAQEIVEAVEQRASEASVSAVETAVEYGHPYSGIRSYVDEHEVDLVVMGTHGRSGLERYLLGSVTEKVVRTSPVPVLTVRSPDADE